MDKPNILVIMSDQHGARWSETYGHPFIKTPNISKLAATGIKFSKAYTNSPLCVPSRMSFMTGKRVQDIEIWDNNTQLPSPHQTWAHLLRKSGYHVYLNGKMHFMGEDKLHGFEDQLSSDPAANDPSTAPVPNWLTGEVTGCKRSNLKEYAVLCSTDETQDDRVSDAGVDFIKKGTTEQQPWAMVVGFPGPHPSWKVKEKYIEQYPINSIPMPDMCNSKIQQQSPLYSRMRKMLGMTELTYPGNMVLDNRQKYFAKISYIDELIGRQITALDESGQLENTIIIYTSDHGEMAGEHGLFHKHCFYDESARIPLIISYPKEFQSGLTIPHSVSLLDVYTTILDLARVSDIPESPGQSLVPLCLGKNDPDWNTRTVLSEYYGTWIDRPLAMLCRGSYKLIYSLGDPVELYNIDKDPHETANLAHDFAFRNILEELTQLLLNQWDPVSLHNKVILSQLKRLNH